MRVLGVDGCKGGWVAVVLDGGAAVGVRFSERLSPLVADEPNARAVGVDMPIGLVESGWRDCEAAARAFLGARRSSVFLIPPRPVVECGDYGAANARCREVTGKGLSRQAFHLFPRILELDVLAARDPRLHEVHPEVAFQVLAGEPLAGSKKTAGGQLERMRLLGGVGVELSALEGDPGPAALDDVLDAAVVAWSAARIARGTARSFPEHGEQERPGGAAIAIHA